MSQSTIAYILVLAPVVDGVDDYAPHAELIGVVYADGAVGGIGGMELYIAFFTVSGVQTLDGEFSVYVSYYDISVTGVKAAVNDCDITFYYAGITHGVTVNAGVEGGLTVVDHVLVEVKRIMQVVLRGTGETGTDSRGQGQREVGLKTGV